MESTTSRYLKATALVGDRMSSIMNGDSPLRTLSYPIEAGPLTLNGSRSHSLHILPFTVTLVALTLTSSSSQWLRPLCVTHRSAGALITMCQSFPWLELSVHQVKARLKIAVMDNLW